jgi:hypothetical protein
MNSVIRCHLPPHALLDNYAQTPENYTDCYCTIVPGQITIERYITAFYNSIGFLPERFILGWVLGKHANAQTVRKLASDQADEFSAWKVEARSSDQLLLADTSGATRSWLMVEPLDSKTKLYFGSAVVHRSSIRKNPRTFSFSALLLFHKAYSRLLLAAATAELN